MTALGGLGAGALGAAGAVARVAVDGAVLRRAGRHLPWGLLLVNAVGCLALGALAGGGAGGVAGVLLGGALVGACTTYSTWMVDPARLAGEGRRGAATVNVALNVGLGLAALGAGWWAGASLA